MMRSAIAHRSGASYGYEILTTAGTSSGRFQTKGSTGLPSSIAIAKRISSELISGRIPTLAVEIWDPFSPQKEPSQLVYSLASRTPLTVEMVQGTRRARQIVEANGFVKSAETTLSGNEKLVSECETQRGAL